MELVFKDQAWKDYSYWLKTDKAMLKKLNILIKEIKRTPYTGTGKPEKLRLNLSGWWSRRISHEHRIVYKIKGNQLLIAQCRKHY